jgi:hypothetical protein
MGESSGLGADKAGKKRFEVKKVTFHWTLLICLFKTLTLNIALFQKVLIFKIEVFATALLDIHKKKCLSWQPVTVNCII